MQPWSELQQLAGGSEAKYHKLLFSLILWFTEHDRLFFLGKVQTCEKKHNNVSLHTSNEGRSPGQRSGQVVTLTPAVCSATPSPHCLASVSSVSTKSYDPKTSATKIRLCCRGWSSAHFSAQKQLFFCRPQ